MRSPARALAPLRHSCPGHMRRQGQFASAESVYPAPLLLALSAQTWGPLRSYLADGNAVRAIEQGFTLLRCSSNGVSSVVDPYYSPLMQQTTLTSGYVSADMPVRKRVWTLYGATHDAFAWLALAASVVLLLAVLLPFEWLPRDARLAFLVPEWASVATPLVLAARSSGASEHGPSSERGHVPLSPPFSRFTDAST